MKWILFWGLSRTLMNLQSLELPSNAKILQALRPPLIGDIIAPPMKSRSTPPKPTPPTNRVSTLIYLNNNLLATLVETFLKPGSHFCETVLRAVTRTSFEVDLL
jgi:hypothetical protein